MKVLMSAPSSIVDEDAGVVIMQLHKLLLVQLDVCPLRSTGS
jgi:hypothetical protein